MNTYRYVFACKCPSDDETIIYGLEVRSKEMIRVEAIKDACAEWATGFQEAIAADLRDVLGAAISLRAQHQGVEILTELEPQPPAASPANHQKAINALKWHAITLDNMSTPRWDVVTAEAAKENKAEAVEIRSAIAVLAAAQPPAASQPSAPPVLPTKEAK